MKALILAAGFGKRLRPITNTIPKSMVEVNGTPLLCNALNNVTACGITEIGIVVGHMADYIREKIGNEWNGVPVRYFENARYLETNNVVSLYKAADFCDDDMIMLECDICYHKEMIERLLEGKGECSILVSPFNPETMDGSVIRVDGDKALELILGKWQDPDFDYAPRFRLRADPQDSQYVQVREELREEQIYAPDPLVRGIHGREQLLRESPRKPDVLSRVRFQDRGSARGDVVRSRRRRRPRESESQIRRIKTER